MTDNERKEILLKAKPILFNVDMVRAILNGEKTVTRRIVKNNPEECTSKVVNGVCKLCDDKGGFYLPDDYVKAYSPYQVGDILYVRETWKQATTDYAGGGCGLTDLYLYKADKDIDTTGMMVEEKWHPSIHMPKEAARIFLQVTDVRAERLQDIDDDGVVAEGLEIGAPFDELWDSTIKKSDIDKYGWAANPFVWVIEFERID